MKTLKERWIDALPILSGIILILLIMYLIIYGISRILPTDEEVRVQQIRNVESIKLCIDNDLDAYQDGGNNWYCEPKNYN